MKSLGPKALWLWSPGIYNLPRVLSLSILIVSFLSLLLNMAVPVSFRLDVPVLFRISPATALAFLMLALSMRLARWERLDVRAAHRAKFSRVLAGLAALLALLDTLTPVLMAAGQCMLAATVILQAYGRFLVARRVLLVVSLITSTWLILANLYALHGRISHELTADPASALLLLMMTLSLGLSESRNGLIPLRLTSVLGEKASVRLLLAAFVVPLLIGYARLQVELVFHVNTNLLLAFHVMSTLLVMAVLLFYSMGKAKDCLDEQRRVQSELESMESVLQTLLEQGSEVYMTINLAGRLLSANETTRRYLGLPDVRRNVVCIEDLILSESHDKMRKLPEALLKGISSNAVLLFKMADGEAMPLYVTAACRMRQGKAEEILLIGRSLPLGLRSPQSSQTLLASS